MKYLMPSSIFVYGLAISAVLNTLGFSFIPSIQPLYYVFLIYGFFYALVHTYKINVVPLILLLVCALSIVTGNPAPVFRSWTRLAFFALLLMSVFPIIESRYLNILRFRLLDVSLKLCVVITIISFLCYFLGINLEKNFDGKQINDFYESAHFSGITIRSMTLAPIAAFSTIYLLSLLLTSGPKKKTRFYIVALAFVSICTMFIASSRGAFLGTFFALSMMFWTHYKSNLSRLINRICQIALVIMLLFPVYQPFLQYIINKQESNTAHGSTFYSRESLWDNRIEEFTENPVLGCGFSAMYATYDREYNPDTGTCEPGSSYLFVLSSMGVLGFIIVAFIVYSSYSRAYRLANKNKNGLLILSLLSFFLVHLIIEGYIFAAGIYLCFMFWLTCGCALVLHSQYQYARVFSRLNRKGLIKNIIVADNPFSPRISRQ